jgi:hypothetical protein
LAENRISSTAFTAASLWHEHEQSGIRATRRDNVEARVVDDEIEGHHSNHSTATTATTAMTATATGTTATATATTTATTTASALCQELLPLNEMHVCLCVGILLTRFPKGSLGRSRHG